MEFTKVTESVLEKIVSTSSNPIYKIDMATIMNDFSEKYPDIELNLDIRKRRTILAGDIEIVKLTGEKESFLMLASESNILEEKEAEIIITRKERKINNRKDKFVKKHEERKFKVIQYLKKDTDFSEKYYRTLGFLARNTEMVARIPEDPISVKKWFDERYCEIKGEYPDNQPGYIIRKSEKLPYGTQIQIIFKLPNGKTTEDIVLEPDMVLVKGGSYDELKHCSIDYKPYSKDSNFNINGNELCWDLLELGFEFGNVHNIEEIKLHVPKEYLGYFDEGI